MMSELKHLVNIEGEYFTKNGDYILFTPKELKKLMIYLKGGKKK